MNKRREKSKWFSYLMMGLILIIVYKTLDNFTNIFDWIKKLIDVLMPFIMAALFAYILYIPCRGIEKRLKKVKLNFINKRARGLSVLIIYLTVALIIFIMINFIIPNITASITELASSFPEYYNTAIEYFSNLPEDSIFNKININEIIENMKQINIMESILNTLTLNNISQYIKGVVGAAGVIFDLFVIIAVSIYLLLERGKIKEFLKSLAKALFNQDTNRKMNKYYSKTNRVFFSFISSQILDAFIVGTLISIILLIMKVKYAVLLGFMIGLFNIIPYLGAILGVLIAVIITLFTGGFSQAITMLIITIVLQQVDANIINPKILGSSLELSPIIIIFSVTIMGAYFGILGMFLAVPIAAMIKVLLLDFIEEKNKEKQIDNE